LASDHQPEAPEGFASFRPGRAIMTGTEPGSQGGKIKSLVDEPAAATAFDALSSSPQCLGR
jgi:hypothetical protein